MSFQKKSQGRSNLGFFSFLFSFSGYKVRKGVREVKESRPDRVDTILTIIAGVLIALIVHRHLLWG